MALTESKMLPLGTKAPSFTLLDAISGKKQSLQELKSDKATVIMFICNHCPFVKHVQRGLVTFTRKYQPEGISFIAINSNDATQYLDDSPEQMKKIATQFKYPFPYLFDETQEIAKAYDAACTPDFYVFNPNLTLVYRGQMDDSRPNNKIAVTGKDLGNALDALLKGQKIDPHQRPSIGCNIKWKSI